MAFELRTSFTNLGVTFIKLGQFLSVRRDILPAELAQELALLQDKVPPFPFEEARAIVERELGVELTSVYLSFETYAMASASIGQVHRAILQDGQEVAVKVQRANIINVINQDLALMRFGIGLAKTLLLKGDWQGWFDLVDEFERTLLSEMNYLQEGRNADQLRQILRSFPNVIIPRIFWRYTTKRIITEELCQGTKIDQIWLLKDIDLKRLARQTVEAYLEQIVMHGYFHADPHAGNLAVTKTGQLIIYDFGMMGYVNDSQRQGMFKLVLSVVDNNVSQFIDSLKEIGIIRPISERDKEYLREIIQPVWAQCRQSSIYELDLSQVEKEVGMLWAKQYFQLPANLAYLIRMIVALESIVNTLNPDFNFVRVASPYFRKIMQI